MVHRARGVSFWTEAQRVLDYLAGHNERIDVNDPRFCFKAARMPKSARVKESPRPSQSRNPVEDPRPLENDRRILSGTDFS
jgi:hypothetical protein